MTAKYLQRRPLPDSSLWQHIHSSRHAGQFMLELTPRCNLNCRHCYINLPVNDRTKCEKELSCGEILDIARQAVDLGAFWCTLTGGDPLVREDFPEIYLGLKRLGLLLYVYTNGTLLTSAYARFFHDYPPRDLFMTVYGVTEVTYERVTRRAGSYAAFRRGLDLLEAEGIPVNFKGIALRSNWHELPAIAAFCQARTPASKPPTSFTNLLHLRLDGDTTRNAEIMTERLTPEEVIACRQFNGPSPPVTNSETEESMMPASDPGLLFDCQAGLSSYTVGYDGRYRLCVSLMAPGTTYDLRTGTLREAIEEFTPRLRSTRVDASSPCHVCALGGSCVICPAYAYLETGTLDGTAPYFCSLAAAAVAEKASDPADD